ncbi:Lhr family ATP-dependent helicase [Galbitalea soli]|uniref:DEAD/DEAH box helicase n=1 Tax=Galbitalea soli TaxID=1268042 RepID=A0A7C9PPC0_9MICO|nr:crosslink repair DNA glycosylase YcaQ family protein [Galbitalea soli]NEM92086.1 DEAD/DEAH box helicase [Galbitalea soli]NYJ31962.1 ATP-dependent Lhr-like helicase [Galbitalea soli]
MVPVIDRFSAATREWFTGAFPEPTAAQLGAWEAISSGSHALVVAPTGSGKTLAAFLWSIDRLIAHPTAEADPRRRTRVLYISPLKALGVDVERNLRSPLVGVTQTAKRLGLPAPDVTVGVRSGDTSTQDRRLLARTPPDILITTPESLYLMLTSSARETLLGVETIIVDEVHAVAATKRGSHLALSLERLDALLERPAQRIGLSATVRPREEVARFLGGRAPVTIVNPPSGKRFDLTVVVPVDDMTELGTTAVFEGSSAGVPSQGSIWPHVEERIVDLILEHRSTIVFANSRRLAERLTGRLNEIHAERVGEAEEGLLARAHHGSVSKDQRALIEDDLKSGRLRCVVATSSLELGIDMGEVDLVVQVEAPPSVASGLQRVGRAGHQVGEVSRGVLFPKHRADLIHTAVVAERMVEGAIEAIAVPANPLDILAQQTVAAVALEPIDIEEWWQIVRRSAPFATLPRSAFEATLDLLSGLYPSDQFAELRPRIVWDRVGGTLTGRPGAQRLAVTSGGTIPDRGMFGVFMVGEKASRVGELDEEMVYESRVGDVFALGATSWRIEDITHDRVLVSPAFGQPGRVPFWKGDGLGRPAELGEAIGTFIREVSTAKAEVALARVRAGGLDDRAVANLVAFVAEQKAATGHVPTDRTLVVERFRDELGDWRVILHSPYGMQVHSPWALAVTARVRERFGYDGAAIAADDGVIVRLPDTDSEPPGAELFLFEADELQQLVTDEVGGSALFAARFRECAARALLLPRYNPGTRSPLWQQRQRASQLLEVARNFPSFPIVLETVREVLQDVYDLPALMALTGRIARREVRILETESETPSPFARSLLFGYVAAFMYEGDSPLAERRAAALSLDPTLLAELLGRAELRELLDPAVIARTEAELQRLAPDRRARDIEGVVDVLRVLGPLTVEEIVARSWLAESGAAEHGGGAASGAEGGPAEPGGAESGAASLAGPLGELARANRVLRAFIAGEERWAIIEDASRLRDALGVPLPIGVPAAFIEPVPDPVGDLVSRYARTHGPFTAADLAQRFGLGVAVVVDALRRLASDRRVVEGEFRPGATGNEWVDAEILRRLRSRSLAALRHEVEPVPQDALARFLPVWQHVGGSLRGIDGLVQVIEQLGGVALPASAWETLILPSRLRDYTPAWLDELTVTGEVLWSGAGSLPGSDGWVRLHLAESAPLTLAVTEDGELTDLQREIMVALGGGGAYFFRQLGAAVGSMDDRELATALWDLVWAGLVTNDTFAPLRAFLGGTAAPKRAPRVRARHGYARPSLPTQSGPPSVAGRWSLLPLAEGDTTVRAKATAELLLERHGIVTRGAVGAEGIRGGFALSYRVLSSFEETGRTRRGYFVEGLGAAQFATGPTVDRLRSFLRDPDTTTPPSAITLAATDPANPYGAALPWPGAPAADGGAGATGAGAAGAAGAPGASKAGGAGASGASEAGGAAANSGGGAAGASGAGADSGGTAARGHRPGRKAGALVVLVDGFLTLYVERGGKTVLTFTDDAARLAAAAQSLAGTVRTALRRLRIERVDGDFAIGTALGDALTEAGFAPTPQGLRLRA